MADPLAIGSASPATSSVQIRFPTGTPSSYCSWRTENPIKHLSTFVQAPGLQEAITLGSLATPTRQVQKSWDAYKVTLTQGNPNPRSRADFVGYSVHTFTRPNLSIARNSEGLGECVSDKIC